MIRRKLRLEWLAALGVAILIPAAYAQQTGTRATLTVDNSGLATVSVSDVLSHPASGVVSIEEGDRILGEALLDAEGQAQVKLTLASGDHTLRAVYAGDASHQPAVSASAIAHPMGNSGGGGVPTFTLSVAAVSPSTLPLSLTAGQSGSLNVTVTPVNNSSLSAPMFVTLSCAGLPSYSTCSFAPVNVEILPTTPTSCASGSLPSACPPVSLLVIQTVSQTAQMTPGPRSANPVAWAVLLPGFLALGGLAFGARRRRWLQRMALMALLALVASLGMTACSPLYQYYNHGPPVTPATPSGTYTVTLTGQSSDGVSALAASTTLVLTVK